MHSSIEAVLSSVILGAWTAFESLASDLWVAGVDYGPTEVVSRLLLSSKSFRSPEDNIGPAKAHAVGVNPRTNFGTFLRGTDKVPLQNIKDISFWYRKAFGAPMSNVFKETADGYIFALAAFRNALTHTAGKADERFRGQVHQFNEFRGIALNSRIELTGGLVQKLSHAAIELGARLIGLVDDLISNPNDAASDS